MTSYETDIRPLFTERDIHGMSKAFNLASYDEVKAHAAATKDRIRGIGSAVMPPPRERAPGLNLGLICSPNGSRTAAPTLERHRDVRVASAAQTTPRDAT